MSLNIKCVESFDVDDTPCGEPAVMVIITKVEREECWGLYTGDHSDSAVLHYHEVDGYCAGHAPEAVHEARSSMADDEFAVVNLHPELVTPETVIPS